MADQVIMTNTPRPGEPEGASNRVAPPSPAVPVVKPEPYGYIVELWVYHKEFDKSHLISRSRVQPRLKVAEACAEHWASIFNPDRGWHSVIVPLYASPPSDEVEKLREENARLKAKQNNYRAMALDHGVCPSCIDGAPDSFGCWDCQNTGWSGGDPYVRATAAEAKVEKLVEAILEACDMLMEKTHGNPARSPGHNARVVLQAALKEVQP